MTEAGIPETRIVLFDKLVQVCKEWRKGTDGTIVYVQSESPEQDDSYKRVYGTFMQSLTGIVQASKIFDFSGTAEPIGSFLVNPPSMSSEHLPFPVVAVNMKVAGDNADDPDGTTDILEIIDTREDEEWACAIILRGILVESTIKDGYLISFATFNPKQNKVSSPVVSLYLNYAEGVEKALHVMDPTKEDEGITIDRAGQGPQQQGCFRSLLHGAFRLLDRMNDIRLFVVRGEPESAGPVFRNDRAGRILRKKYIPSSRERPIYVLLSPKEIRRTFAGESAEREAPVSHERRGHYATLSHDRFERNADGTPKRVWRKATWVGDREFKKGKRVYRVLLDKGEE